MTTEAPSQPRGSGGGRPGRTFTCWKKEDKIAVAQRLWSEAQDGQLPHGTLTRIAHEVGVTTGRVARFWREIQQNAANGIPTQFTPKKKVAQVGKRKYERCALQNAIKQVSPKKRKTIRTLAKALGVKPSTLHLYSKRDKILARHNNKLKPKLSDDHKDRRVLAAIDNVAEDGTTFKDLYDEVHIDEKWFYLFFDKEGVWIVEEELMDPEEKAKFYRSVQHKSHIQKLMFLAATARPRFNEHGECIFDGKIGIWPFVKYRQAQRNSVNRPRGTWLMESDTCTKETYKKMLIEKLFPAIREKFPQTNWNNYKPVRIKHDNATPHKVANDEEVIAAMSADPNRPIELFFQPSQSPDNNINDLAFFRAIQSMQQQMRSSNPEELLQNVRNAWDLYPPRKLNRMWLTLMSCLDEILKCHGGNDYKIPHLGKEALERTGELPTVLELSDEAKAVVSLFNF